MGNENFPAGTTGKGNKNRSKAGTGLVEVMVASIVIGVAILSAVMAMVGSMSLTRGNRDGAIARQAARLQLESMQGVPFAEVFAAFNDDAADDVGLTVAVQGSGFNVIGLTPQVTDLDNFCGRISFPVAAGGPAGVLREDQVDAGLGMPRDLDMDGLVDAVDHSANYVLLPVRVQVQWLSAAGNQTITLETVLSQR